jgi:hypothetical protein
LFEEGRGSASDLNRYVQLKGQQTDKVQASQDTGIQPDPGDNSRINDLNCLPELNRIPVFRGPQIWRRGLVLKLVQAGE